MKKILFILFFAPIIGLAQVQTIDNDTAWIFTRIVNIDSTSQLKLFGRANEWFINMTYNNSKSFISENLTGKLSSEIQVGYSRDGNSFSFCKVSFIAKDNKYKIELSDFWNATWGNLKQDKSDRFMGFRTSQKNWLKLKSDANKQAFLLLDSFIKYMNDLKKDESF